LRAAILSQIGVTSSGADHAAVVDSALDELADALERHLDIEGLLELAQAAGR